MPEHIPDDLKKATFAGGCFWCMEKPFKGCSGVLEVVSGYTGGQKDHPTYKEVCSGMTGHLEAIEVTYDPSRIRYEDLLDIFWKQIDPTDDGGQFNDRGKQYRTVIFYHDDGQKRLAEESRQKLTDSGRYDKPIVTEIVKATVFYKAEDDHQEYYKKEPVSYNTYRFFSGRDSYLRKIWGKEGRSG